MDWLERYLQAVRKHLPWQRQDDIIAELRANLEAQLEERQEKLGRALTEGEILDWLKELGPPMMMASQYQPARYLIGPNLFGIYWLILRLSTIWASIAFLISVVVRIIVESHEPAWIAQQVLMMPYVWLQTALWVTLTFAFLEFAITKNPEKSPSVFNWGAKWNPATLPPLQKPAPAAGPGRQRSYAGAVAEFIVHCAVVVWLLLIPSNPWLMLGPAAAYLHNSPVLLLPVLMYFYWAVVIVNAVRAVWLGYLLVAEEWRFKTTAEHLITKVVEMVPMFILITAPGHQYVMAKPGANPLPAGLQIEALNHYIWTGCVVLGAIVLISFVVELVKAAVCPPGRSAAVMF